MQEIAQELKNDWDFRLSKTDLQRATIQAFGCIHEIDAENIDVLVGHLQNVISSLPPRQSELFDAQSCYPGFLSWNNFWKESYSQDKTIKPELPSLEKVHLYYQNWTKKSGSQNCLDFQKLWECVMIRSTSEAMCETVGSIMKQHCSKNRHLEPEFFSMEMVMRVNLGPLHLLGDFIEDVLSNNSNKSYLRKETRISQIASKDMNKSAALTTFQSDNEKKSRFPTFFWLSCSSK